MCRNRLQFIRMKTVIITGGTGNLGKALISQFSGNGYHVLAFVHQTLPPVQANVTWLQADLTQEDKVEEIMKPLLDRYEVNAAVLTAGGFDSGTIENTSIQDIRQMISLNFETAYSIVRPLFAHMLNRQKGDIVLIGSQQGKHPQKGVGAIGYTLSKSLLFALAQTLNEAAEGTQVKVQVAAPATIDTPQNRESMPKADTSQWIKPEELAKEIFESVHTGE